MNIFGIGLPEMMLIFVVALLIFGPKKLPEIGRSLGKTLRSFQDATNEFKNEFQQEMTDLENTVKMQAQLEPETSNTPSPNTTEQDTVKVSEAEVEKPTSTS